MLRHGDRHRHHHRRGDRHARQRSRASASATLRVAGARDTFAYWDGNGNGDLTCSEAVDKDEGLRLPAYRDNRDGTGLIYEWLERGRSSDSDNDGISCESSSEPQTATFPFVSRPPRGTGCARPVRRHGWDCRSVRRSSVQVMTGMPSARRTARWRTKSSEGLPKSGGQVYTPYSCKLFDIRARRNRGNGHRTHRCAGGGIRLRAP